MYSQSYVTIKSILFFIIIVTMGSWVDRLERESKPFRDYKMVWATRYSKTLVGTPECGNCISIEDTAREGFYYDTEQEANIKGHQSMVNDSLEGYKVYFKTFEVYPTLKPK